MDMIKSREISVLTNKDIAEKIAGAIRKDYCREFEKLVTTLDALVREIKP